MTLRKGLRRLLRSALLGRQIHPAAFDLPLHPPQTRVRVWLHGLGEAIEVTTAHAIACPAPFTLCLYLPSHTRTQIIRGSKLRLLFFSAEHRLLGKIWLAFQGGVSPEENSLFLYRVIACTHYALHPLRRWIHFFYAVRQRRNSRVAGSVAISSLDERCNELLFSCPRPVALVSVQHSGCGNIFPMNLMAQLNGHCFVFALNSSRHASTLVATAGQLVVSHIPYKNAEIVRQLGPNHHRTRIDWAELPFKTRPSANLGLPVPEFALSIQELIVDWHVPLGSHTFFIAHVLATEQSANHPEFHRMHGLFAPDHSNLPPR